MTGTDHLPPERRLPPRRRDQILRSVLNGEEPTMSYRHRVRWIAPIAAAAAAALIAVGAVALSDSGGTPTASQPSVKTVPLDLGPMSEAEIQESRLGSMTLNYTRRIDGPIEPITVLVATNKRGTPLFDAGQFVGVVEGGKMPNPAHPIRDIDPQFDQNPDVGDSAADVGDAIYDGTAEFWKITGFYRVDDSVDRVEVRVGTPDGPERWRVAEPHGGWVFWATWFDPADYEPGTELTVKWRAYDKDGDRIDPDLMPDQPRTVTVPDGG
jgi:hypothetical protein